MEFYLGISPSISTCRSTDGLTFLLWADDRAKRAPGCALPRAAVSLSKRAQKAGLDVQPWSSFFQELLPRLQLRCFSLPRQLLSNIPSQVSVQVGKEIQL